MSVVLRNKDWLGLITVVAAAVVIAPGLSGQESPQAPGADTEVKAAAPTPADEPAEQLESDPDAATADQATLGNADSLLNMILDSGATGVAFMAVLGLFSLVAASVALERAVNMRRDRILPRTFVDELGRKTAQKDAQVESLRELCSQYASPIATVLQAGLSRCGHSLIEVEKSMEDAAAREMAELRAKIRPLRTVGGVAPLIGLLGTVVGMIIAFHTASQAGLGKAELLAKGIYMALLTTAGGLSVAIPAMLLGAFFTGRAEKFFREMDVHLLPVVPLLANSTTPVVVESPAASLPTAPAEEPQPTAVTESPRIEQPPKPADPPQKKNPLMA